METKNIDSTISIEDRDRILRQAVKDLVHSFNALVYLVIDEENGALSKSESNTESEV